MSFKIRMKMFIAESRTCVSAESCGKGTALSQPFGFIFAHSLFICWWCCLTGPQSGLRLPGWDWKDIAAACVWTSLPRVSARTFLQLGGPVDMRAGGSVCVCPCARACAQPGVCWGGSLCVFFCVISWLLGDCLGVTLCVCVCVLELCVSVLVCLREVIMGVAGCGSGCVSLWSCMSFSF